MIHAAAVLTPALSLAVGYIQPALGLRSHSACRRPSVHIVIMSGRCVNCTLRCDGYLCRHCKDHIQCVNCCRYLPSHCYPDASKRCLACTRKLAHTRSSVRMRLVYQPRAEQSRSIALSRRTAELYRRSSKTTDAIMVPFACTSVSTQSSQEMLERGCCKEFQPFFYTGVRY